jgi:hypothetical protein
VLGPLRRLAAGQPAAGWAAQLSDGLSHFQVHELEARLGVSEASRVEAERQLQLVSSGGYAAPDADAAVTAAVAAATAAASVGGSGDDEAGKTDDAAAMDEGVCLLDEFVQEQLTHKAKASAAEAEIAQLRAQLQEQQQQEHDEDGAGSGTARLSTPTGGECGDQVVSCSLREQLRAAEAAKAELQASYQEMVTARAASLKAHAEQMNLQRAHAASLRRRREAADRQLRAARTREVGSELKLGFAVWKHSPPAAHPPSCLHLLPTHPCLLSRGAGGDW